MYRKGINLKLPEFIWKEPIVLKYINILMYQSDTVILNITNSTLWRHTKYDKDIAIVNNTCLIEWQVHHNITQS
jgi:hypothetical protein